MGRMVKFPLAVDRAANMALGEQLFRKLKEAIVRGIYKPGEHLPCLRELAEAGGVSEKAARQALARLAHIGWCDSKRGARSVVVDRGKDRRGRVLFFNAETGLGFHSSRLVGALRSRLLKADYRLTAISADDLRKDGSSSLLSETLKEHWDLVIEFGRRLGARRAIEDAGWPFIVLGDGGKCIPSRAVNCVGQIELRNGLAVPHFVRACAQKGVRSAIQFIYDEGGFDATEALAVSDIKCETIRIPRSRNPFGMYSGSFAAMNSLLVLAGHNGLPDVFLFTDDHLAHGGLLALMAHGVRIPDDVRVVTHANRGLGPFWIKPLTRLEMDPVAQGDAVAHTVLEYFQEGRFPEGLCLGSRWCLGETF